MQQNGQWEGGQSSAEAADEDDGGSHVQRDASGASNSDKHIATYKQLRLLQSSLDG